MAAVRCGREATGNGSEQAVWKSRRRLRQVSPLWVLAFIRCDVRSVCVLCVTCIRRVLVVFCVLQGSFGVLDFLFLFRLSVQLIVHSFDTQPS